MFNQKGPVYTERQCQCCEDTSDTAPIETIVLL